MAWKPDYITDAQYRAWVGVRDVVDTAEIAVVISAASRAVDRACHRQFGQVDTAEARYYPARWNRHRPTPGWVVEMDDLDTTSGLVVSIGGTAVSSAYYQLEPRNAVAGGRVWTHLAILSGAEAVPTESAPEVAITALWGWSSVPVPVTYAARVQSHRFAQRRSSPYGIAGSPDQGSELRLLDRLDPDVRAGVSDYVRRWGAR